MKKTLLLAMVGLVSLSSVAEIKVELKGFTNDSVRVQTTDVGSKKLIAPDTVIVAKKGKLVIADVKENACVRVGPKELPRNVRPAFLYIAPGEKFKVTFTKAGENIDVKVEGSEMQTMIDDLSNKQGALVAKINTMKEGAERDSLINEFYNIPKQYVRENLDSPITLWAMQRTDAEFAEEMLPKIGDKARNSMFGFIEKDLQDLIKAEIELQAAKAQTAEGEMAPEFELPTPDGSMLKMSSLRGKWVLVDFWGSWCIWCIRGIPQLKENYEKYKDKMEVLSIACRDKKEKWLAAIEKHHLDWKHVISLENVPGTDKKVEALFGVEGYPTKLLVDPEGRIVKRCVGEDPKFYDDFGELMK